MDFETVRRDGWIGIALMLLGACVWIYGYWRIRNMPPHSDD